MTGQQLYLSVYAGLTACGHGLWATAAGLALLRSTRDDRAAGWDVGCSCG